MRADFVCAAVIAMTAGAASAQNLWSNYYAGPGPDSGLATGATLAANGIAAPAGQQWSEVGHDAANNRPGNSAGAASQAAFRIADDFTIPAGETWNITSIAFFNYQTGGLSAPSTFTGLNFQIWNGSPAVGGSTVVFGDTTTNRLTSSTFTGLWRSFSSHATIAPFTCGGAGATNRPIFENSCDTPTLSLSAGTYWIDYNVAGQLGSGPWSPNPAPKPIGTGLVLPGSNGLQFNATWNPIAETGLSPGCVAGTATAPAAVAFIVRGTKQSGCRPDITTGAIAGQPGYGVPNGVLNNDDFFYFLAQFAAGNLAVADVTTGAIAGQPGYGVPNGVINNDDFFYYLAIFAAGC